jgi:carboxymethylenebutenolidase
LVPDQSAATFLGFPEYSFRPILVPFITVLFPKTAFTPMKIPALLLAASALLSLPAVQAQDWALGRLEGKSSRHQEWVKVPTGTRPLQTFITYPEISTKATVVIVIHENMGLTDWARSFGDQLAEAGYISIAVDLITQADGKTTVDIVGGKVPGLTAGQAISALTPDGITADLNAVVDYAKTRIPAANGKVVVAGFCWGGQQTFRFATNNKVINAAFSFYGPQPTNPDDIARITAPVYGFYAGNDMRVNATIDQTTKLMKDAGKTYEPVIYNEGSGHGFMRAGDPANPDATVPNKTARDAAWKRLLELLKKV